VSVKRTRRGKKIKEIIGELDKLIAKNKKLKEKYTGKGVDVKRDAGRSAKPFGYRFVGKHDYRVPTADQIKKGKKRGTIDYEGRPNRSDVYPKGQQGKSYAKLAKGGMVDTDEQVYELIHKKAPEKKGFFTLSKEDFVKAKSMGLRYDENKDGWVKKMSDGGMMDQGYDDKEDERLGMEDGKLASKDFIGSRKHRKHSRRDDAQFEERGKMAKGGRVGHSKEDKARFAKPAGWRWKEIAVTKRVIERKQLSMQPSKKMRDKYPDYVYYEDRLNKADKKPSRKYLSE
jgi:hypothetical protein